MPGFYIEQRALPDGASLSKELAQHIFTRGVKGSVVVVTERPHELASITKKQWYVLIRHVQRERASTLKMSRITELSNQLEWMERLRFTSKLQDGPPQNSVTFATPDSLINKPPVCSTLYVTEPLDSEQFHLMTSWLAERSVVIVYAVK